MSPGQIRAQPWQTGVKSLPSISHFFTDPNDIGRS
jgi:hypothetical protein